MDNPIYFLIYDNRLLPYLNFSIEANVSSYYRHVSELVVKWLYHVSRHAWLDYPTTIAIASSPSSVQFVNPSRRATMRLLADFEPRYSHLGGSLAPRNTWKEYLSSAVDNITSSFSEAISGRNVVIFVYTTDAHIIGDQTSGSIADGLATFLSTCKRLRSVVLALQIRLLTVPILKKDSTLSSINSIHTNNKFLIYSNLIQNLDCVSYEEVSNTAFGFDEELRTSLGLLCPPLCWRFSIVSPQGMDITISAALWSTNIFAYDGLQQFQLLELCSISTRDGIHPLFIHGTGLFVGEGLRTQDSDDIMATDNRILLCALASSLAQTDIVLIFRSLDQQYKSQFELRSSPCYTYWALIPAPKDADNAHVLPMTLLKLHSRDFLVHPHSPPQTRVQDCDREKLIEAQEQLTICLHDLSGKPVAYNAWSFTGGFLEREVDGLMQNSLGVPTGEQPQSAVVIETDSSKRHASFQSASTILQSSGQLPLQTKPTNIIDLLEGSVDGKPNCRPQGGSGVSYAGRVAGRGRGRGRGSSRSKNTTKDCASSVATSVKASHQSISSTSDSVIPELQNQHHNPPANINTYRYGEDLAVPITAAVTASSSGGEGGGGARPGRLLKRKYGSSLFSNWEDIEDLWSEDKV